ncbi:ABC transporter ATP-binding protein [Pseudonocardia pini]|uniref:ABC transporter ATP-binding protein n=1 Tax=Pseudonocardia pini TaxID=2758030 RepID=UPI0015F0C6F5|nr:ABC transporter ATP-binding protein [Pseudonocardia pini]
MSTDDTRRPDPTEPPPALALRGIVAGYGRVTVLSGVDIVVPERSVVAVMGPNGAGKSTLLKVASGLLPARGGRVELAGEDVTRESPHRRSRRGICAIPEGRGIFPDLTVQENLVLHTPRGEGRAVHERAFEAFPKLKKRLSQRAGSLSGGEQQMLALSRCFLVEPRVVLLDEVSMGLAPIVVDEVYAALDALVRAGVALLLVEQYVHRALAMASVVHVLTKGVVGVSGTPDALAQDELAQHYLGGRSTRPDGESRVQPVVAGHVPPDTRRRG